MVKWGKTVFEQEWTVFTCESVSEQSMPILTDVSVFNADFS